MRSNTTPMVLVIGLTAAACSGEAQCSAEYPEPAAVEVDLAEVSAQRDAVGADSGHSARTCAEIAAARYARSEATPRMIVADPVSYATEDQVLDLLDTLAAAGTMWSDEAFGGATGWRHGWRLTLFAGLDADVHIWQQWISDDGSVGGSLGSWAGTADNGGPFDLVGIDLDTFDDDGLVTSETVHYAFESSEVLCIFPNGE